MITASPFTTEELTNILILINKAPLTGAEAAVVASLQKKLNEMIILLKANEPKQPEDGKQD